MDRKLIIFLAFVSVMQNYVLPSSAVFTGFPGETFNDLQKMPIQYQDALFNATDGFEAFYTTLVTLIGEIAASQSPVSAADLTTKFAPAFSYLEIAFNLTINSISLIGKESCAVDAAGRNVPLANLKEGFAEIIKAIELAGSGDDTTYKAEINEYQSSTETAFTELVENLFVLIDNCVADDTREILEHLIKEVQESVTAKLIETVKITYEAIDLYETVISATFDPNAPQILITIEPNQINSTEAIVSSLGQVFALYETLFIDNYLGHINNIGDVYKIQAARKVFTYDLTMAIHQIFVFIETTTGLEDINATEGEDTDSTDIPSNNEDSLSISFKFYSGAAAFLDTVASTQPATAANVTNAKLLLPGMFESITNHLLTAISSIRNKTFACDDIQPAFDVIEDTRDEDIKAIYKILFDIIHINSNTTIAAAIEPTIALIEKNVYDNIKIANDYIFRAVKFVAEIRCNNRTLDTDDSAVLFTYEKKVVPATAWTSVYLSYASLIKVLASAGY